MKIDPKKMYLHRLEEPRWCHSIYANHIFLCQWNEFDLYLDRDSSYVYYSTRKEPYFHFSDQNLTRRELDAIKYGKKVALNRVSLLAVYQPDVPCLEVGERRISLQGMTLKDIEYILHDEMITEISLEDQVYSLKEFLEKMLQSMPELK